MHRIDSCVWRRGWDSNPRDPCGPGSLARSCLKPLDHPSAINTTAIPAPCALNSARPSKGASSTVQGNLVPVVGVEPTPSAYEAAALPLGHTGTCAPNLVRTNWRREWDLNPRSAFRRSPAFEAGPISLSGTSPYVSAPKASFLAASARILYPLGYGVHAALPR
jgi:hypothetical protein